MSLYLIVGGLLLFGAMYEYISTKSPNFLYVVMFSVLLFMLCFRYGQGTDYFAYQYIYEFVPTTLNISKLNATSSIHSELGWKFLCALFKVLGFDYYVFVAVIGAVTMFLLNRFIQKYCPLKTMALFIAYPTLYLTYISSGLRQGLTICIFLGVLLDLYLKNKKFKFLIGVLLCSTLHTASLVLLILFASFFKEFFEENSNVIVIVSWVIGVSLAVIGFNFTLFGRTFSNEDLGGNYVAMAERLLTYVVMRMFYNRYKTIKPEDEKFIDTIMYIYSLSMILYGLFFSMPTVSSRICYFFKSLEIILITVMISAPRKIFPDSSTLFLYIALLSCVMLVKNLDSYLSQGMYYSIYNVWNFPYNNIFIKGNYRYSIHLKLLN